MWEPRIFFEGDNGGPGGSGPSNSTGQGTNGYGGQGGPGGPGGPNTSPGYSSPSGPSGPAFGPPSGTPMSTKPSTPVAPVVSDTSTAASSDTSQQDAAQQFAQTEARIAAQGAGRESAGYARAQGLNPAQAALLGGQTAGNAYGGSYGTNLYNKLGLDMQKYAADKNYQMQQNQINQQNQNNTWNAIGTGISFLAPLLLSDQNAKEDIKDGYGILDRVTKAVGPKTFKYKSGDGATQVGILAQDLEKTPLASTVQDTPNGKMIDAGKLTAANTGMLSELSKKVDTLYSFLKEASHGPARAS